MIDLYKYTSIDGKLPLVNVTPEQLADIGWHSIPAVAGGAVLAMVLIYVRAWLVALGRSEENSRLPGWLRAAFAAAHHVGVWYLVVIGIATAVAAMPVSGEMKHVVRLGYSALSLIQLGLVLGGVFKDVCQGYLRRGRMDGTRILLVNTMITVGTLLIWALIGVAMLNTFGVNVTALLAGLGLGGIAIAFATKNIFENMLASFSMVLNPPFVIGDFIVAGEIAGTVEGINLKYVLIRQLSGEQLTVPSSEVLNTKIHNYARMRTRRIEFKFGVGYAGMTPHKLERVPQIMKEAIEAQGDKVKFDRAHFSGFGDLLMNFEGVFIVQSPDYNMYMDVQQAILTTIYRRLGAEGIELVQGMRGTAQPKAEEVKKRSRAGLPSGLKEEA